MKDLASFYQHLHRQNRGVFYHGLCSKPVSHDVYALGYGKYLSWSESMAKAFALNMCETSRGGKPIVDSYKLPQELKLLDAQSDTMAHIKSLFGLEPWEYTGDPLQARLMTHEIQKLGYDGVISDKKADGLVVFDEKRIRRLR